MSKRVLISIGIAVIAVVAAFLFFKMDLTKQEDPDLEVFYVPDDDEKEDDLEDH